MKDAGQDRNVTTKCELSRALKAESRNPPARPHASLRLAARAVMTAAVTVRDCPERCCRVAVAEISSFRSSLSFPV